ncbi:MAG: CpXC domain-containing protein [Kiritimatiellia bacterium]
MSQKKNYTITCPKCRAQQETELFESVNVGAEPQLKESLLQNQINLVTCGECGFSFRVDKPLLYHDPAHAAMIYYLPLGGADYEKGERHFREFLGEMNAVMPDGLDVPDVHLVFSWAELIERVFLLEASLDPRLIEYIKYIIYTKNTEKLNPETKAVLFNAQDSTPEQFCFVVQDVASRKLESILHYSREAYDSLCETFDQDEQTPMLLEMFPGPYVSARALLLRETAEDREDD